MSSHKYLVIQPRNVGFFSLFFQVLGNLEWCDREGYTALVDFTHEVCPYWIQEPFFGESNAWNYYFEPISSASLENLPIDNSEVIFNNSYHPPKGTGIGIDGQGIEWNDNPPVTYRKFVNLIIAKHIRIKPRIRGIVDEFSRTHLVDGNICGVHIRRTDSIQDPDKRPPTIESYLREIDRYIHFQDTYGNKLPTKIFLATDDALVIKLFKSRYPNELVYYHSTRSESGQALHKSKDKNRAKLGEDVLVESLLLSKTDFLVHSRSNVSSAALYFTPDLDHVYVMPQPSLPKPIRRIYGLLNEYLGLRIS